MNLEEIRLNTFDIVWPHFKSPCQDSWFKHFHDSLLHLRMTYAETLNNAPAHSTKRIRLTMFLSFYWVTWSHLLAFCVLAGCNLAPFHLWVSVKGRAISQHIPGTWINSLLAAAYYFLSWEQPATMSMDAAQGQNRHCVGLDRDQSSVGSSQGHWFVLQHACVYFCQLPSTGWVPLCFCKKVSHCHIDMFTRE